MSSQTFRNQTFQVYLIPILGKPLQGRILLVPSPQQLFLKALAVKSSRKYSVESKFLVVDDLMLTLYVLILELLTKTQR